MTYDPNFPEVVSIEEEQASVSGLALAPWVELQARPIRAAHLEARRNENTNSTIVKIAKWRRGVCAPREGFHRPSSLD